MAAPKLTFKAACIQVNTSSDMAENIAAASAFARAAVKDGAGLVVMPENVSPERKAMIRGYGASMTYSSPYDGSDGAILLCRAVPTTDVVIDVRDDTVRLVSPMQLTLAERELGKKATP